jgi:hypothetical protein
VFLASGATAQLQRASKSGLTQALAKLEISDPAVSLRGEPLRERSPAAKTIFTRQQAYKVGIDVMVLLEPIDFTPPIWNGRGLAAGDIDQDGYTDILVATKHGIRLFMNQAGAGFVEEKLPIPEIEKLETHVVGLVDIDNDGWLDIFLTTFRTGIYYILSDKGEFGSGALAKAPEQATMLSQAASFGDIDEDGDLDIAIGNYFLGRAKLIPPVDSTNKILFNEIDETGSFRVVRLSEAIVGDTHSILLSDFNQDDHLDLIVGNDFLPPDAYYSGNGKGEFKLIKRQDGIIPVTTLTTMSIDTADYNNDLRLDIYVAQIAAGATGRSARIPSRPLSDYCKDLERVRDRVACELTLQQKMLFSFFSKMEPSDILGCKKILDREQKQQCAAMMFWMVVHREQDEKLCDRMPKSQPRASFFCHALFLPPKPGSDKELAESIEFLKNENTLLRATGKGTFENVARELAVAITGFSWNSKFADFDNDGWQDIYVVNGTWATRTGTPQKFLLRNLHGEKFEEVTDAFGLQNYMGQSAFVMVDFDNDGDLDIIANSISGPIWLYKNNDTEGNSIVFEIRDHQANRYGIGCKLRIYYMSEEPEGDSKQLSQLREIKSGGGYSSFDAPFAHFGLGAVENITRIEIDWSTGGTTTIEGSIPANARYTIRREANP